MKHIPILLLLISTLSHSRTVFIVIHGTWAINARWHMPGGDFFDELEKNAHVLDACVVPYLWTGSNNYASRMLAAKGLVKVIQSYPVDTQINLVTHSHGSNVGIIASQLMAQETNNQHKIDLFYALGTPVQSTICFPNMQIISYFYHLFSFEDLVQPVLGLFERQYPEHERIANISVTIDNREPTHSQLHHAIIARWLPYLHEKVSLQQLIDNHSTVFAQPGIVHFYADRPPHYEKDSQRVELLERSDQINQLFLQTLLRKDKKIKRAQRFESRTA